MENELVELDGNDDYEEYDAFDEDYEEDSGEESETLNSDEEDEEDEEEPTVNGIDIDAIDNASVSIKSKISNSIIRNKLTKYEYTRIFSSRVTHIQNGSVPMVSVDKDMTVEEIVKREFEQGRIPLILERTLPKEKGVFKEYRRVNEVFNVIL
jgi:DNA-directed RNA polymerase subunit K/omega